MTVKFQILDEDDDNRMLRDGERRTVHLMMKDGITPKPGFSDVQIAIAATKAAMKSFDAAMHDRNPGYIRRAATADSVATHDAAFDEYARMQDEAWKTKAPPAGAYSEGSFSEGDPCTVNGSPGVLQAIDGQDGWLECVVTDGTNNADDSRVMHDTRTPQQIKDAAYAAYDSEITDAWRNK